MKNHIEKRGLPETEIIYNTPRGSKIKILSAYDGIAESEVIAPCEGGSPAGTKGQVKISTMPGLADIIATADFAKEKAFVKRYPGIDELLEIIHLHAKADEALKKMMETGDSVLRMERPPISITDAHEKYPIASAYLKLLGLADANPASEIGFIRRKAGENAFTEIAKGADVITALQTAENEIERETKTPAYKEHVAGL